MWGERGKTSSSPANAPASLPVCSGQQRKTWEVWPPGSHVCIRRRTNCAQPWVFRQMSAVWRFWVMAGLHTNPVPHHSPHPGLSPRQTEFWEATVALLGLSPCQVLSRGSKAPKMLWNVFQANIKFPTVCTNCWNAKAWSLLQPSAGLVPPSVSFYSLFSLVWLSFCTGYCVWYAASS